MSDALVEVRDVHKRFPIERSVFGKVRRWVHAINGVSFDIKAGETLGLVGESSSGKSTIARLIMRLLASDAGSISFDRRDVVRGAKADIQALRKGAQMIFQDPYSSLDPTKRISDSISEPLRVHDRLPAAQCRQRVLELLEKVGLSRIVADRYPYEFSGGQRQRIAIARALARQPKLIVADEAVSALDVSTQAQVLNLMSELKREQGLAYLFISHDLHVVRWISDRVAVLYLGKIVEIGGAEAVSDRPLHPYTQSLVAAVPRMSSERKAAFVSPRGEIPDPTSLPRGCPFHARCPAAIAACREVAPVLVEVEPGRSVACHLVAPQLN